MSQFGKELRLNSIFRGRKYMIGIPMDHGAEVGPIAGIEKPEHMVELLAPLEPSVFLFHRGILPKSLDALKKFNLPFMLKLNTVTDKSKYPDRLVLVDSVEDAVRLGASGVAIDFYMGTEFDSEILKDLSCVSRECEKYGMPLMVMAYPMGFENNYAPTLIKHVTRISAELGADIVKTSYTGSKESFKEVVESCLVPVVVAGGPKVENFSDFLNTAKDAIDSGASGLMTGRNIWQAKDPYSALKQVEEVVWG